MRKHTAIALFVLAAALLISTGSALACGGLFCQNIPIAQQAERIIFTINGDDTVTAYVQINYTGSAPDFSWVVPVPAVPEIDVAEIDTFNELDTLTAPIFIPPLMPECVAPPDVMAGARAVEEAELDMADDVTVLSTGTAGPYGFDVITSENPDALIEWLNDNRYRVMPEMEPLIRAYNEENMVFLAMKLQPEAGAQDIQPVVMTYTAETPTIPIRLTAVAANPNMNIVTWVFASQQAIPQNYAHIAVDNSELRADFSALGGTNYMSLVDQRVDSFDGKAFITEYAMPSTDLMNLAPQDPLVRKLAQQYPYVTRLFGRMSPEEMTLDPAFVLDGQRSNQSNVHDLSEMNAKVFWQCPGAEEFGLPFDNDSGVIIVLAAVLAGASPFVIRRKRSRTSKEKRS